MGPGRLFLFLTYRAAGISRQPIRRCSRFPPCLGFGAFMKGDSTCNIMLARPFVPIPIATATRKLLSPGEFYDAAAIQSGLRDQFGGVRFGKFVSARLCASSRAAKKANGQNNDVAHRSKAGRVLDLNEHSHLCLISTPF